MIKLIKNKIKNFLQQNENKLIGGVLFSESTNSQILLFENFGLCTQNNLSLKSEITNHYVEENYWINDHWAVNPPQYVLSGLIGELIYTVPNSWAKKIESIYESTGLGLLSRISPSLGSYTYGVLNVTRKIQSVVNKYTKIATQAANKIKNFKKTTINKTNQRKVLDELESLMNSRTLVNIYTPYGTYNRLAIIAINIRQGQDTKYVSDVEITFQKWRSSDELYSNMNAEKMLSDTATAQKSTVKNRGFVGKIKSKIDVAKMSKQSKLNTIEGATV